MDGRRNVSKVKTKFISLPAISNAKGYGEKSFSRIHPEPVHLSLWSLSISSPAYTLGISATCNTLGVSPSPPRGRTRTVVGCVRRLSYDRAEGRKGDRIGAGREQVFLDFCRTLPNVCSTWVQSLPRLPHCRNVQDTKTSYLAGPIFSKKKK